MKSATYKINDGSEVDFKDGTKLTVGQDLKIGESVTITLTMTDASGKVSSKYTFTKEDLTLKQQFILTIQIIGQLSNNLHV